MLSNPTTVSKAVATNLEAASRLLARFRAETVRHFIAGRPDSGNGQTFDDLNPIDNSVLCQVAAGSAEDIERAAQAATGAFPAWQAIDGHKRQDILHTIADRIEARAQDIALIESVDTGQPIRFLGKMALRA